MKVSVSCPTRVDLAGGTLDCWPLSAFIGKCYTVNLSIDVFTNVEIVTQEDQKIHINVQDMNYERDFENLDELLSCSDKEVQLIAANLMYWRPKKGFSLKTSSQSPIGGGLGGSSSMLIALLKGFGQIFKKEWDTIELVNVAHNIEARLMNTLTGTQDYFPAAQPGLNILEYSDEGVKLDQASFSAEEFNQNMSLIFTGKSHHSGINNWQVIQRAVDKDPAVLGLLKDIAEVSSDMRKACLKKEWHQFPELFQKDHRLRMKMAPSFNSPEIDRLEIICAEAGADATKVCGAGGGGCVLVWSSPDKKEDIKNMCESKGFQVIDAKAVG